MAPCPDCNAVTSFDTQGSGSTQLGGVIVDRQHQFLGTNFSRILWRFYCCNSCSRGAVAKLHDYGDPAHAVLEAFLPSAV